MTRELAFKKRSKAELISNISGAAVTLLCALKGFGVWSLVAGYLALNSILTLMVYYYSPWRPKFSFVFKKILYVMKFGITLTGSRLLWYFYSRSDVFIIGRIFGGNSLGYYSLALTIASIPIDKITSALLQVMYPAFSRLQNDRDMLAKYFLKTTNVTATIMFPILVGLFLIADDLIPLLLTNKWAPMIPILKIFCLIGMLRTISIICTPILLSIGKPNLVFVYNVVCSIVMPMAFLTGTKFGLIGVAYAWLVVYPMLFLLILSMTIKSISVDIGKYLRQLTSPLIGTMTMALGISIFQQLGASNMDLRLRIFITCALGFLMYSSFSFIFESKLLKEAKEAIKLSVKSR